LNRIELKIFTQVFQNWEYVDLTTSLYVSSFCGKTIRQALKLDGTRDDVA
jgi:hypothetical protein